MTTSIEHFQIPSSRSKGAPSWHLRLVAMLAVVASISGVLTFPANALEQPIDPAPAIQPMVIGGHDTTNDGFVAALLHSSIADPFQAQFCGGSLISPNVVITAAHCVESFAPGEFGVVVGQTVLSAITPADRRGVTEILIYPGWIQGDVGGVDMALVRLGSDVTTVAPIPIETDSAEPSIGRQMTVVGWGAVDPSRSSFTDVLQSALVPALSSVDTTPATMVSTCLSDTPADDVCFGGLTTAACNGDSGGPLVAFTGPASGVLELEALVSYGPADQCLSAVAFDAGQRLSPYKSWIDAGVAAWAPPPQPPITLPGAPGNLNIARGNGMADISWAAPTDDGGDQSLTYTVTGTPGGSCTTTTTSCHIGSLTNGLSYQFVVSATNSSGQGPASASSGAVFAAVLINCDNQTHPFLDLPVDSFARSDIGCIAALDITHGTSGTTYDPSGNVTRAQMAAFLARLYRAITGSFCGGGPLAFTDVSDTSFARDDIACIASIGITTGLTRTTYGPDKFVTRAEMAAFLARLYGTITWSECGDNGAFPFTDVSDTFFARDDIACIASIGITTGTTPTTYGPHDLVTRVQMAAFLARLYRWIT